VIELAVAEAELAAAGARSYGGLRVEAAVQMRLFCLSPSKIITAKKHDQNKNKNAHTRANSTTCRCA
jgi:hypothetical protein